MIRMKIIKIISDENAQGLVEYAMIISFVSVLLVVFLINFGKQINGFFNYITNTFSLSWK